MAGTTWERRCSAQDHGVRMHPSRPERRRGSGRSAVGAFHDPNGPSGCAWRTCIHRMSALFPAMPFMIDAKPRLHKRHLMNGTTHFVDARVAVQRVQLQPPVLTRRRFDRRDIRRMLLLGAALEAHCNRYRRYVTILSSPPEGRSARNASTRVQRQGRSFRVSCGFERSQCAHSSPSFGAAG
jgi:hypothetical protein